MKKKILALLFLLCSILLVTGCGDNNEEKESNDDKTETKKELSLTDSKVLKNYDLFRDYDGEFYSTTISAKSTKSSEIEKTSLMDRVLRRVTAEDRIFYNSKNEVITNATQAQYYTIKASILENYFNETYGGKVKFNKEDHNELYFLIQMQSSPLNGQATTAKYNKEKDEFEMYIGGIGGNCGFDPCTIRKSKLVSAYEKGNKLYLVEKQVYVLEKWDYFEFKGAEVYSDYEQKNQLEANITDENTNYENYLERGSEVTIVLQKGENDKYYFVESIVN